MEPPVETPPPAFRRDFERNRPREATTPSYSIEPRSNFSFQTPAGWQAHEQQSEVTVAPPSEYVNGNLANGVIFGVKELNGATFQTGTHRYIRNVLSANSYLKTVGLPENNVFNDVPCITTRLTGWSPQSGANENVVIYTCQRNAQKLFYVVSVNSGPNASRYEEQNSRVIQSISFR
ncbi:MAG: hypothetical protein LC742_04955 [Acidobacteria bacterium]|nr:hypothetical protein [Acidobacteriota bacterium]